MESINAFLEQTLGYILKAAAQSKMVETVQEELLNRFWQWLRPFIINDLPEIEQQPDAPNTETKTQEKLLELIQDEAFFKELVTRVNALQTAGIKEKNIVRKNIERVKHIKIGDKVYSPTDHFDRKNIVEGNVKDADEFTLGDGH